MKYGYIEDGYLRANDFSSSQIAQLSSEWKPVDDIDEAQLQCEDGFYIKIQPYDAGDHIAFHYEKKFDTKAIRIQIQQRKDELASEDYKVVKCYEASLLNQTLPYDIQELHTKRQSLRAQINELEEQLTNA